MFYEKRNRRRRRYRRKITLHIEPLESRRLLTRPHAVPDTYQVMEDVALIVDASEGVLANDSDQDGDQLFAEIGNSPRGNWQLKSDGAFRYVPPADFSGLDFASYTAVDASERSFQTLVYFNVEPANDSPVSLPESYLTLTGETLRISKEAGVLANDHDADGDRITAELVVNSSHGTLELNPDGSFSYVPLDGFEGEDSFSYYATDGSSRGGTTAVSVQIASQPIVISEIMASNATTLTTRVRPTPDAKFQGDELTPDWIELHNRHSQAVDLSGLYLTDDEQNPAKWALPADIVIEPSEYLLIFASGEDVRDPALDERGYLHANFQLSSDGEYLALNRGDGIAVFEFSGGYPRQQADVSYGLSSMTDTAGAYFVESSPGRPNIDPRDGFVEEADLSVERGFFQEPFFVELATATPAARIRYTLDGTDPSETNGLDYDSPLNLAQTTTLRVAAFRHDLVPSQVVTHTYFFLDDVLAQNHTPPDGFPATWGNTFTDWGMDQDPEDLAAIAGNENFTVDQARDVIKDSLLALPSMSLVTSIDGMFGKENGIYANTEGRGERWERPVSVEYIDPSQQETGFQIDAGIRIQGYTSRNPSRNPKHSLRLVFRDDYGAPQLEYPLFGNRAAESFNTLVLRSNSQDAWVYDTGDNRLGQFIRDQWARETLLAMGQVQPHGNWVHLYINGLYWGLYNPTERPDASFAQSYLGGSSDDYDIVKNHEEIIDGTADAYNDLLTAIQKDPRDFSAGYFDFSDTADYQRVQGNNPDGTRNLDYPVLIDVPSLIDYVIVGAYAAANDWPGNFYMGRDRTADSAGFKFFMWDNEHGMKPHVRSNRTRPHRRDSDSPTKFYHALRTNDDFRLLFADHLQRAFFEGGVLYVDPENTNWNPDHPERNVPAARWMELTGEIEQALIAEATRWGDLRRIQYTPHEQFQKVRDRLLEKWFPVRSDLVLDQFKSLGLYPEHTAPVFGQHGGTISDGFELVIQNPNEAGQMFYTLDGTDPRLEANLYASPVALSGPVTVKSRVLLGGQWSALNEVRFTMGVPATAANLRVSEINFNPAPVTDIEQVAGIANAQEFEFLELVNVGEATIDLSDVTLELSNREGSLEGIQFDFEQSEITMLATQQTVLIVEDLDAFRVRYGDSLPVAGQWEGKLSNAGETISLHAGGDLLQRVTYSDQWFDATDGGGKTLEFVNLSVDDLDLWNQPSGWRESSVSGGSPGEIMIRPIPGDSNHDGLFNSADLVVVFQAGEYQDGVALNSSYETGDWNGDGEFDSSDFVFAFQKGGYLADARIQAQTAAAIDVIFEDD